MVMKLKFHIVRHLDWDKSTYIKSLMIIFQNKKETLKSGEKAPISRFKKRK